MKLIDRLKELEANATMAPWDAEHRYVGCEKNERNIETLQAAVNCGLGGYIQQSPDPDRGQLNALDLAFIVEMRNALPKLLAVVEAAKTLNSHPSEPWQEKHRLSMVLHKALAALDDEGEGINAWKK